MSLLADAAARYSTVAVGLVLGTAAKYGLALGDGQAVTWRGIIADLLLLGLTGLIAVQFSEWAHLTGNAQVLAGAMMAVSSDRLIRLLRKKIEQRAASEIDVHLPG